MGSLTLYRIRTDGQMGWGDIISRRLLSRNKMSVYL